MQAILYTNRYARGIVALFGLVVSGQVQSYAQQRDTIPSQAYFQGIEQLYEGDYRDAERTFRRELRGAIKTVAARWIDSICYHAMLGEVYYHQGRNREALEQFNNACGMFLQYPKWMLRVKFSADPRASQSLMRRALPWGRRGRQFALAQLPSSMLIGMGQLDNREAVRQGGVVRQAQYWKVNVVEIVRTTALAIRRRNELLGPLGAYDSTSRELVTALSRGGAPPNHWSEAWIDLQLGLAQVGTGETKQAMPLLERSTLLAGKFDHALTCVALAEQGRLLSESGNTGAAANVLAEASNLAFYYDDLGIMDEAFRLGTVNRLVGTLDRVNPMLQPAADWARRKRLDHLYARISLALAEELMAVGNWDGAQLALNAASKARIRNPRVSLLGIWSQYLDARMQYHGQRDSAPAVLAQAVNNQIQVSKRIMQIGLTNSMYDSQQLSARKAVGIYQRLLSDPTPEDTLFRPLETLAVMKTPHHAAFDRWLGALLSRKDVVTAIEVTDLAKRRHYQSSLAWGGRLAALRRVLEATDAMNSPEIKQNRVDLLLRYPAYDQARKQCQQLVSQLREQWWPGMEDNDRQQLARIWKQWSTNLYTREAMLREMGLQRVVAAISFPPRVSVKELKTSLQPGQALLVFHNTSSGILGFLVTSQAHTYWNLGPGNRIGGLLSKYLRDLGNHDANRQLTLDELTSSEYLNTGKKLFAALFDGSSIDLPATKELIVVPDQLIWYVPLDALPVETDDKTGPLISISRVRYAPTIGLGVAQLSGSSPQSARHKHIQRTGIVVGEMVPGDDQQQRSLSVAPIREAVAGSFDLQAPQPVSTALIASLLDTLLVLADVETGTDGPLAWSPLPLGRDSWSSLNDWLELPEFGPQHVLLPGMHTPAERGLKAVHRGKAPTSAPGDEMFLASCGLMSTGAQTVLLSRWRVGGQSTVDLMRELAQELPHTTAAAAWQRSVQLAMETPIDPLTEMRVKSGKEDQPLTATHPFFWGGYLIVDTGVVPAEGEKLSAEP